MRHFLVAASAVLFLAACSAGIVPPPKTASTYFQEGETYFEKGLYDDAIASWEKVLDSYYSPELNILTEKKIAEAHFLAGNYLEAALAYEEFLKQHPGQTDTAEVLFQLGMAYYKQILSSDRDQTATRNALATFNSLLQRYPDTPHRGEAREKITAMRARLAENELYIGRFYLQYGHPEAAIRRLRGLFTAYPDFAGQDEAYFLLGRACLQTGREQEAVAAFAALSDRFPDSEFVEPAQKILAKSY